MSVAEIMTARAPALPAAYAPFAPVFHELSAPLQKAIGGQLSQFERMLTQFAPHEQQVSGELEGFDGLALRGDFSHILQSELLLRTEAPLEFLRRLSEAETLYLDKRYVDPGARAIYRLAISCGPALLGHARIAALSALFFFARLAGSRGGSLQWCFAPRTDKTNWYEGLSASSVRAFLHAAAYRELSGEDLAALTHTSEGDAESSNTIDWLLLADPAAAVTSEAPRALLMEMRAPVQGAPRQARLSIKRRSGVNARFLVTFPEDETCVAALREPFAPRTKPPPPVIRRGSERRTTLHGWAPHYFVSPRQGHFLIRRDEGLLVLVSEHDNRSERINFRSYWLEVSDDVKLAGAELANDTLFVALQGVIQRQEAIWIGSAWLGSRAVRPIRLKLVNERRFPSSQLFAKQPRHTLPGLDAHGGGRIIGCYSTLGQSFRSIAGGGQASTFEINQQAGRIIFDNGICRAFWGGTHSDRKVRLEQRGRYIGTCKTEDGELDSSKLLGAHFDHASGLFCYSLEPGRWTVLSASSETPAEVQTRPADQIVSIRPKDGAFEVRLWSDARYGGDGSVRLEMHRNFEVLTSRTHFNFDQVGGTIGKYEFTLDGSAWAVVLDEGGEPARLVRCRRKRKGTDYAFIDYDLNDLASRAERLELDVAFD